MDVGSNRNVRNLKKQDVFSTSWNKILMIRYLFPSWNNVRMLAYYTMLRYQDNLPKYTADIAERMKQRLLRIADDYLFHIQRTLLLR